MSERFAPHQIIFIKASIWSLFVLCVMNKIRKFFILFNIFNKIILSMITCKEFTTPIVMGCRKISVNLYDYG